jgi:hypothetical protein
MDFVLSQEKQYNYRESILLGGFYLSYSRNSKIIERELCIETDNYYVICDANLDFISSVLNDLSAGIIERNINRLVNGFILYFDKKNLSLLIFTDIFGYFHLFHLERNGSVIISTEYNKLLPFSRKQLDDYALLDLILFNYALLDRTIISDIKRFRGGSKIILSGNEIKYSAEFNFADCFKRDKCNYALEHKTFSEKLSNSVLRNLLPGRNIFLSLTAGFDSRMLLAICRNLNLDISTFTIGQDKNIEEEIVSSFIHDIYRQHHFFKLETGYLDKLPDLLNRYLSSTLDNPVILDLPHYHYAMEQLPSSNVITGFMGGELTAGQLIGSQVTFTRTAAELLLSKNLEEAELKIISETSDLFFVDPDYLKQISRDYIDTLSVYLFRDDKSNILSFLINESYSKFFGTVNLTFGNHSNLINPFMDAEFISYILNSRQSFLLKKPFISNPLNNIRARITYAKGIKYLYPPLGNTMLDRLYKINDLCSWYRYPNVLTGYLQSHLFKKNKKQYPKPHHYDLWYGDIVMEQFRDTRMSSVSRLIAPSYNVDYDIYNSFPSVIKKKHSNMAGLKIALDSIARL